MSSHGHNNLEALVGPEELARLSQPTERRRPAAPRRGDPGLSEPIDWAQYVSLGSGLTRGEARQLRDGWLRDRGLALVELPERSVLVGRSQVRGSGCTYGVRALRSLAGDVED